MDKGLLIVLSGPSGTGKGTVCQALVKKRSDIKLSVSCTTRLPRTGEQHGRSYFFISREEFDSMIKRDDFLEYAGVFDHQYGTPKSYVEKMKKEGQHVLLEIDVQGALKVKKKCPDGVYIFLVPPSINELENRIRGRATESEAQIISRLGKARDEMAYMDKYDYVIVNDEIDRVVEKIECILESEKMRTSRNSDMMILKGDSQNDVPGNQ